MCNLGHAGVFIEELLRFNAKSYCFDVCGYHWRHQTLAEISKKMGNCCGFRAVVARGRYPGFMLLPVPKHNTSVNSIYYSRHTQYTGNREQ